MPTFHVQLLGDFQLHYDGKLVTPPKQVSLQALLACLVLQSSTPLSVDEVATIFWPDASKSDGPSNLILLSQELNQALPPGDALLQVTGEEWRWQPGLQIESDVASFVEVISAAEREADANARLRHLEKAIALYTGDFLPGYQAHWALVKREWLHNLWLTALRRLIELYEQQGEMLAAIAHARRLWRQDPLFEGEYQRLVHLYVLQGERADALN